MITVFLNSDSVETFTAEKDEVPFNLEAAAVESIEAYVVTTGVIGKRYSVPATFSGDRITVDFGDLTCPPGIYEARFKMFSPDFLEGKVWDTTPVIEVKV